MTAPALLNSPIRLLDPQGASTHDGHDRIWSFEWTDATPGEHTVTSRATDTSGNVQPAPEDPSIAGKHTYWESNGQVTRRVAIR